MVAFRLAGAEVFADHSGALWWPAEGLLAFADLHFEKGSSFAVRTSQMLPPYDTRATLSVMEEVVGRLAPRRIVCLGDNFHDPEGPARLESEARARLQRLMQGRCFVWIEGNHDQAAAGVLGGESAAELAVSCSEPPPCPVDRNRSGNPIACTSQSSMCVSTSVQAGLVDQSMPWTPRPALASSPRIDS